MSHAWAVLKVSGPNSTGTYVSITNADRLPSSTDGTYFGDLDVGNSLRRTFRLEATGSTATILAAEITGDGWRIVSSPSSVPTAGTQNLVIEFAPVRGGLTPAEVVITCLGSGNGTFVFDVSGNGLGIPDIKVNGRGDNPLGGFTAWDHIPNNDASFDFFQGTEFGQEIVGPGLVSHSFQIDNTGTDELRVYDISVTGGTGFSVEFDDTVDFISDSQTPPTFKVKFNPTTDGIQEATVSIDSDDPDEDPYTFEVRGQGVAPLLQVYGGTVLIANGDDSPSTTDRTDFGTVEAIVEERSKLFRIENNGSAGLVLSDIVVTGPAFDLIEEPLPGTILNPGESATFRVNFSPTKPGPKSGDITVTATGAVDLEYQFDIAGNATGEVELAIIGNNDTTGTFGFVVTGASTTNTFEISNTGTASITIGEINIASDFSIGGTSLPFTVAAGSSKDFTVTFNPSSSGVKNDTVRILEDGSDDEVFSFKVRGKGIAGNIVVRQGANAEGDIIDNGLTNPPLDSPAHFQTWPAGSSTIIQTFAIKNTGNAPLLVSSASISGNQAFTISSVTPGTMINGGDHVSFTVNFVPTSAGTKSATVSIASADPLIPIFTFEVVGIATGAPDLAVTGSPNSNGPFFAIPDQANVTSTGNGTDFGTLNAAIGSETITFEITNTGNAQLTISSISESSPHFNVGSFPTVIGVGNTKSFTVTFDPTSSGPKSTEIEIISNAVGSAGSYTFVVTGRGEAAKILVKGGLDQDKLIQHGQTIPSVDNGTDFGLVNTNGTASVKTFAISNSGDFNLTIISATSSNHDFALANIPTVAQPIAPGSEQDFEISFDPSSVGLLDSTITIKSNDPGTPEFTFIVEGFGSDNQPEIQVVGLNNQVIQSGAAIPTKLNGTLFGPVDINGTARQKTFTIENLGTGSLNL